jgi:hypothetical protein
MQRHVGTMEGPRSVAALSDRISGNPECSAECRRGNSQLTADPGRAGGRTGGRTRRDQRSFALPAACGRSEPTKTYLCSRRPSPVGYSASKIEPLIETPQDAAMTMEAPEKLATGAGVKATPEDPRSESKRAGAPRADGSQPGEAGLADGTGMESRLRRHGSRTVLARRQDGLRRASPSGWQRIAGTTI